ncbi:hypothetical protein BO82DRAFT_368406 [Aspergillus uvarum CBS 121591]|uniref:Uncharacterized protein n=1 Tax=Aspergillus uvarum CBS 121591 TaxID=1448315 RepID=A0A319CFZ5_9EURO|nr:hypothetical protein BO82DRAFT_368406 [Aspergillus uvarum CBS 121591]PYH77483.1 hypothetical protein BO82DRAFT_368406 [Aspergillus uvarum CBS 121591]
MMLIESDGVGPYFYGYLDELDPALYRFHLKYSENNAYKPKAILLECLPSTEGLNCPNDSGAVSNDIPTQAGMSREFETDLARRFGDLLGCCMTRNPDVARDLTQDRERGSTVNVFSQTPNTIDLTYADQPDPIGLTDPKLNMEKYLRPH